MRRLLPLLSVLALTGCASAQMRLPDNLAAAARVEFEGIGGWRSGDYAAGGYAGRYERSSDRLSYFDTVNESRGHSEFTLTGPDANGYYTVTLTGVQVPDNAVMLTGGLGYSYSVTNTLPLTQTNVAGYPVSASPAGQANEIGGLIVVAPNAIRVATNYTGRRAIVEDCRRVTG